MKRVLRISKEKGSVDNRAQLHEALDAWLDCASNGDFILRMDREQRNRSSKQNGLMWFWFGLIAYDWSERCGYAVTSQDVHDAFCIKLHPKKTPLGVVVAGNTKALTEEQMTAFLDYVKTTAESFGMTLPTGDDRAFEKYMNEFSIIKTK